MDAYTLQIVTCIARAWPAFLAADTGLTGRAVAQGRVRLRVHDLREHGEGVHRRIDDAPFGGGAGMLLMAPPLLAAIAAARAESAGPVVILAPRGRRLSQPDVQRWAQAPGLTLVCGRYEGIDERVYQAADECVSVGDFVLSGGDPAAWCIADAVLRLRDGTLGNAQSLCGESFADDLLQHPQYTRPDKLPQGEVPAVLRSGDHGQIARWRQAQREALTQRHRPDLWAQAQQSHAKNKAGG